MSKELREIFDKPQVQDFFVESVEAYRKENNVWLGKEKR